jgi:hypothetical protein
MSAMKIAPKTTRRPQSKVRDQLRQLLHVVRSQPGREWGTLSGDGITLDLGRQRFSGTGDASTQSLLQLASILKTLRATRPPGRPRKVEPAALPEGKRTLDPELALQAYRLKRDRLPWYAIARRLLPGADRSERTRDRVRRLVGRGARLSSKKLALK